MEQLGSEIEGFSGTTPFFTLCEYEVIYLRSFSTVAVRTHSGEDLRDQALVLRELLRRAALPLFLRSDSFTRVFDIFNAVLHIC